MKFIKRAICGLLSINCAAVSAQSIVTDTSVIRAVNLGEVVISVNKTEEEQRNVAQQVQILKANEIQAMDARSTADVLSNTGNVFVQKSQFGGGSPVLRGFEANRILLVVDGVRLNNIIYRAGHLQNIVTMDNAILDRVEVLFGPSSTIYGSDALGGVIHLFTKKPEFAIESEKTNIRVNAFSRYGTVCNEKTGHADINLGWKNFASLTSFTFSDFDDLKSGENQNPFYSGSFGERPYYQDRINNADSVVKNDDRYLQRSSGYTQYDLLQKLAFRQNDKITHGLNIQHSNSSNIPRYDRLTDPGAAGLRYGDWYYGPQKRSLIAYDFNLHNAGSFIQQIHAGISFQDIQESRHNRNFGSSNISRRVENVNVLGVNLDFHRRSLKHKINFGIDGQYNTLKSTAERENITTGETQKTDTRYPDGDNIMNSAAAYVSHTWQINSEVAVTDGLRAGFSTLHSTISDNSFFNLPFTSADQDNLIYSGSIGVIHTPSDDLKLSFLVSTGFRAPNVDDLAKIFESSAGSVIVPNPDLKPEQTVTTEAGILTILSRHTTWETNLYYTSFHDAIVTDRFKFNGADSILYDGEMSEVLANQNKQRAYLYGFSSRIRSQLSNGFTVSLSANYTYGRIKTDSSDVPLDHIPPFMSRFQLSYIHCKFNAGLSADYNGWKRLKDYHLNGEDNEQYATPQGMPAWFTINIQAAFEVHRLVTVQAGVDNIFDTQYRTFSSGINAPGRNIFAAIKFHY